MKRGMLGDTRPNTIPQPIRFAFAGGLTAVVYLGMTLVLSGPLGVRIQVAVLCGYVLSLCIHFSLQRYFVFRDHDRFALAMHRQAGRYLAVALTQYAFTATAVAVVPGPTGVDEQVVYVCAALIAAVASFLVLRARVFHGS